MSSKDRISSIKQNVYSLQEKGHTRKTFKLINRNVKRRKKLKHLFQQILIRHRVTKVGENNYLKLNLVDM